jgi:hypothetical protein
LLKHFVRHGYRIVDSLAFRVDDRKPPGGKSSPPRARVTAEIPGTRRELLIGCLVHPGGGMTWHFERRRRGAGGKRAVDFPVKTDGISGAKYVLTILATTVAAGLARKSLESLSRKWEQNKIEHAIYRFGKRGIESGRPLSRLPHNGGKRGLLFIHGTFSSTISAFNPLYKKPGDRFLNLLREYYDGRIYGFDHPTISVTPDENARWLLDHLERGETCTYDVIAHSRGGLVARSLLESIGAARRSAGSRSSRAASGAGPGGRMLIDRVVLVGVPNLGSPLVPNAGNRSIRPYESFANWLTNVAYLIPGKSLPWVTKFLAELIRCMAAGVKGVMPGVEAFAVGSDFLEKLNSPSPLGGPVYYAIGSNFEAPRDLVWKLVDAGADTIFRDAENDLTVSTSSATTADRPLPSTRRAVFSPFERDPKLKVNVHHFAYFKTAKCLNRIAAFLGLPRGDASSKHGSRGTARSFSAPTLVSAVVPPPMLSEEPDYKVPLPKLEVVVVDDGGRGREYRAWIKHWRKAIARAGITSLPPEPFPMHTASMGLSRTVATFKTRGDDTYWHALIGTERSLRRYLEDAQGEISLDRLVRAGTMLMQTLFPGDARILLERSLKESENQGPVLINFTSTNPWVADFPWEMIYDAKRKRFLSLGDVVMFRGVVSPRAAVSIPVLPLVIRMLIAVSQPVDQYKLAWQKEVDGLMDALQPLITSKRLYVDVLEHTSPRSLERRLGETSYHILHYIGHADYDEDLDVGTLILETERTRRSLAIDSRSLCLLMARQAPHLRLVVLNGCETAEGGRADFNKGVAPALVASGVPAVVGNRLIVGDAAAITFATVFYESLSNRKTLAEALMTARRRLATTKEFEAFEWAVPIVFAIDPEARFF